MSGQTILDLGVRADLAAAHEDTIADLGRPGDWMTAAERVATVAVVRAALADAATPEGPQPPWSQPSADHTFEPLAPAAIDAAWRLTNHSGTLTADWYEAVVSELPSPEWYVEFAGVVAVTNALDRLASLLDAAVLPVVAADGGEPRRPEISSSTHTHWVPTAVGFEGPNVLKASTVAPTVVEMRSRIGATHYMTPEGRADLNYSRGTLDRRQIELVAGVTSMHNECFY